MFSPFLGQAEGKDPGRRARGRESPKMSVWIGGLGGKGGKRWERQEWGE